jgi:hypothetical protein
MVPAFVLPFLINFGVNKAMGMSTGKALGLAGVQAFVPIPGAEGSTGAFSGGAGGGIGSIVGQALQGEGLKTLGSSALQKQLLMEGGKTLISAQADKRYGINPMLTYGGLQGLQGGIGALGTEQGFTGGFQQALGFGGADATKAVTADTTTKVSTDAATKQAANTATKTGGLFGKGEGILGYGTGADIGAGLFGTTLLTGMGDKGGEEKKTEEKVNVNYPNVKDIVTNFNIKDPVTGATSKLAIGETPEERFMKTGYTPRYKDGGIAQFNQGALVSMLPGKSVSDEKDPSIYKRAYNFVTDETGNGDMEEDTMLAQLADGEFVTTAKAVLGAGIFQGAKPSDISSMRDKGAKFFYEQQARFKRIYEMLEEAKQSKEQAA